MSDTKPKVLNKRTANLTELANSVYVGRPTKWGNPFRIGPDRNGIIYSREVVINLYQQYLTQRPELVKAAKRELKGKNLVCWCAPAECHADILLKVANE